MVYWNDKNWCGQNVIVSKATLADDVYTFTYRSTGTSLWGAGFQLFYNNSSLTDGSNYTVTFDLNSTAAGKIRVNGQVIDLVVGDNHISVTYTEGKSSLALINGTFDEATSATTTIDSVTFVISNLNWVCCIIRNKRIAWIIRAILIDFI